MVPSIVGNESIAGTAKKMTYVIVSDSQTAIKAATRSHRQTVKPRFATSMR